MRRLKDRIPYGIVPAVAGLQFLAGRRSRPRVCGGGPACKSYESGNPNGQTVVDLDGLAKAKNANWVWKGAQCARPLGNGAA